jgi:glycosyltransferase EpsF
MPEPERIAQVIGCNLKGGVEQIVFEYYRFIDKSKFQFDFISDEDSPYEIPEYLLSLGCKVIKIPPYRKPLKYINTLKQVFSTNKYRIVHSHMNTLSVFTLFAAKSAGVPIRIAHSHSTAGKGEFKRNILKYILRPFSKIYPTHCCACSEYAGRWLFGNRYFEKGKVTVIRNAIDTEKFTFHPEIRNRVRNSFGIEHKFVIGHVGRFMKQKNHDFLIDVFAELHKCCPESILMLVGDGELREKMQAKVKKLGLTDAVLFLGIREDVDQLYQAMDVFILPSLYEGLPVVGVEVQCVGLPCIFSDRVTREAKLNDQVPFLPITDVNKWVTCILEYFPTTERKIDTTLIQNNYSVQKNAEALCEYYSLIKG